MDLEPLGLSANQWQFLAKPDRYVEVSGSSDRPLHPSSTRRQFRTARAILERLNGSHGQPAQKGVLLADDVGLGKTTVAALVAWVIAGVGGAGRVRILAPNEVMARRWEEELRLHVSLLEACAPALFVEERRIKAHRTERLAPGSIQVVKHSYAREATLACDLLIVDEAHRAKGENSAFSTSLKRQRKRAKRLLFLTATPFSIRLAELEGMLRLVGGAEACPAVRSFSRVLDGLYSGDTSRSSEVVAERLAERAAAAVAALSRYVIRHGVDGLPRERTAFGERTDWQIDVPEAKAAELEVMLRMDRALRLARLTDEGSRTQTNDARFHVGWRHLDRVRQELDQKRSNGVTATLIDMHLRATAVARTKAKEHPKAVAVGEQVRRLADRGEKVVCFCHHHATAQELTLHLDRALGMRPIPKTPSISQWRKAWVTVLAEIPDEMAAKHSTTFAHWLSSSAVRSQVLSRSGGALLGGASLPDMLKATSVAGNRNVPSFAEEARRLLGRLADSRSGRAILREAATQPELIPGGRDRHRVLAICRPPEEQEPSPLFIGSQQPDTAIAIFNSPFGPDVLVVTDRLSEGIDLHRYCRHMIHYELDPSPIRTVQRNGRIRRVNSWAAVTGEPIQYAYPAFRGTRDHRLVQIMKKRIDCFSLLLGGVQDFDLDGILDSDERWRSEVVALAKQRLARVGNRLQV
jgi:hypothetical protein